MSAFPKTSIQPDVRPYPISVKLYHQMIEAGMLTEDDPVELLEGTLVFTTPKNPPHETSIGQIQDLLPSRLLPGWILRLQAPVTLMDGEPAPDVSIARGTRADYLANHPGPTQTPLVIEVSDSTVARDRGIKLRSYARAGIAHYWIVNLVDNHLECYAGPQGETYLDRRDFTLADSIGLPAEIGGALINVADFFPPK